MGNASVPEIRCETPLVGVLQLPYQGHELKLSELAYGGHVNLRGDAGDPELGVAVQRTMQLQLPLTPNSVSAGEAVSACWLGPDEWLLRLPAQADAAGAVRELEAALAGRYIAINDVSSAQTVLQLQGARTREVLEKGCTLDLHPRGLALGQCAQTLLAKAPVLLVPGASESMDVVVRRSFADYLARWLLDAAR